MLFLSIWLIVDAGHLCQAEEAKKPRKICVLVSRNIRPYRQAVVGFEKELKKRITATIDTYTLKRGRGVLQKMLKGKTGGTGYDLVLAVGPEATEYLWKIEIGDETKRVYAMVLNPPALPPAMCGVPLDIPASLEIRRIKGALPTLERLGILFDPSHNDDFVRRARTEGRMAGLEIVPLRISSRRSIPSVLGGKWGDLDGLWLIPDPTVISESLVKYLIKEALSRKVPVIGYNRFFYRSGAALSFILNYEEIGKQAAGIAIKQLSGEACGAETPFFRTWLNLKVIAALGIPSVKDSSLGIEPGP